MTTFLIGLGFGMFLGYMVADLLSTESKITYHIKRLRAKKGATIQVEAEATQSLEKRPKRTREERKADRVDKRKNK